MNHYTWLRLHLSAFLKAINNPNWVCADGLISAHGDKCYCYRRTWEECGMPFEHGVAIYMLTYCSPYDKQVRETDKGWVDVRDWVISVYPNFKQYLPEVERGS